MMKETTDSEIFLEVCDKLKDVPDCHMKESTLFSYMIAGQFNKKTFIFADYDKDKMKSCIVLTKEKDLSGRITLFIVFQWIDPHFNKQWKKNMIFIEKKAKELGAVKISFTTARNEKAIERKIGKYGYKKVYNVIEKEVV